MKMKKFQRRKAELERKYHEEIEALRVAEEREMRKKIDPLVAKLARVAEEEARRLIEASPDIVEDFSFRKKSVAEALQASFKSMFDEAARSAESEGETTGSAMASSGASGEKTDAEKGTEQVPAQDPEPAAPDAGDPFDDAVAPGGVNSPGGADNDGGGENQGRGFAPFRR